MQLCSTVKAQKRLTKMEDIAFQTIGAHKHTKDPAIY